jgi:hypothetical protein
MLTEEIAILEPTPLLQSILWDIQANPEFQALDPIAEMMRQVRIETEPLWPLWGPERWDDTHANLAGVSKDDLLYFYLEQVLPLTVKSGTIFPVLYFLWKLAPEDLGSFKTSHEEIAEGSGAGVRSVPRAIAFLEEKHLLAVYQKPWSKKESPRAEYTLVPLAKLKHTPSWLESLR